MGKYVTVNIMKRSDNVAIVARIFLFVKNKSRLFLNYPHSLHGNAFEMESDLNSCFNYALSRQVYLFYVL
jgi:hypothetical protein